MGAHDPQGHERQQDEGHGHGPWRAEPPGRDPGQRQPHDEVQRGADVEGVKDLAEERDEEEAGGQGAQDGAHRIGKIGRADRVSNFLERQGPDLADQREDGSHQQRAGKHQAGDHPQLDPEKAFVARLIHLVEEPGAPEGKTSQRRDRGGNEKPLDRDNQSQCQDRSLETVDQPAHDRSAKRDPEDEQRHDEAEGVGAVADGRNERLGPGDLQQHVGEAGDPEAEDAEAHIERERGFFNVAVVFPDLFGWRGRCRRVEPSRRVDHHGSNDHVDGYSQGGRSPEPDGGDGEEAREGGSQESAEGIDCIEASDAHSHLAHAGGKEFRQDREGGSHAGRRSQEDNDAE